MDRPPNPIDVEALLGNRRWLGTFARGLVGHHVGDDVAQQTWLTYLEKGPTGLRTPRGWFSAVARNVAWSTARRDRRRSRREGVVASDSAERVVPSAADLSAQAELLRLAVTELSGLRDPFRSTLVVHFFHDQSLAEIARREGVAESTVRSRLQRGLAILRQRLDRQHDRSAWMALLSPPLAGAGSSASGLVSAFLGVLLMKLALSVSVCVVVLAAAVYWLNGSEPTILPDVESPRAAMSELSPAGLVTEEGEEVVPVARVVPEEIVLVSEEPETTVEEPIPLSVETHGFVSDGTKPLAEALVTLLVRDSMNILHATDVQSTSGRRGEFPIPEGTPRDGSRSFVAEKTGYAAQVLMLGNDPLIFKLVPAVSLSGYVREKKSGAPIEGAILSVSSLDWRDGKQAVVRTDANGYYEFDRAPTGRRLALRVMAEQSPPLQSSVPILDGPTRADFDLDLSPPVAIRVIDAETGLPVPHAEVRSLDLKLLDADADGSGSIRIPLNANAVLWARADGYCASIYSVDPEFNPHEEIVLRTIRSATVRGHVLHADRRPIAGATARLMPLPPRGNESVSRYVGPELYGAKVNSSGLLTGKSDESGAFEITGIDPKRLYGLVDVTLADGTKLYGEAPAFRHPGDVVDVEVVAGPPIVVSGVVSVNGEIAPSAKVEWSMSDKRTGVIQTDPRGDYTLAIPDSGAVTLTVTDAGTGLVTQRVVSVVPGVYREDFDLYVTPRRIYGVLMNRSDLPIEGAVVMISADGMVQRRLKTDARGEFETMVPVDESTEIRAIAVALHAGITATVGTFANERILLRTEK